MYLPGEQLSTDGTTTTGIRYYTFAGHVIAQTTPTTLYWLSGNTQGTMTTAVAAFTQSTVIRRATTPYGTTLNGTGTWPDNRGFLGDPGHAATGLVDVGARKYNPATGLFISVDPALSTSSPQTMTGYTYAADNLATNSDPSGLCIVGDPDAPPIDCKGRPIGSTGGGSTGGGGGGGNYSGGGGNYSGGVPSRYDQPQYTAPSYSPPARQPAAPLFTGPNISPYLAGCNQAMFKLGACPSESGLAGTTPRKSNNPSSAPGSSC